VALCSDKVAWEYFLGQLQQRVHLALGVCSNLSSSICDNSVNTFKMELGEDAGLDDFVACLVEAYLLSPLQASKIRQLPLASCYSTKKHSQVDLSAINKSGFRQIMGQQHHQCPALFNPSTPLPAILSIPGHPPRADDRVIGG
jgi:hypothetical protein